GVPQPMNVSTADTTDSVFAYTIAAHSFYRLQTTGTADNLSVGTAQIVPSAGFNAPATHAIFSDFIVDAAATAAAGTTMGNTIFETSVEAQRPATELRFYAEASGDFAALKPRSTRTTIAIANPSDAPATIQLELTSFDGKPLGSSSPVEIRGGGQLAWYLEQFPGLSFPVPFQGV